MISISIREQKLRFAELCFPCSTGKTGIGSEPGSGKTPLGRFEICSMHGENAPLMTVFRSRMPVGTYPTAALGEDCILTRILALDGLEHHNANTRARYIYIHGTNETSLLGSPASHGCIRLAPQDMLTLFNRVSNGTPVLIEP